MGKYDGWDPFFAEVAGSEVELSYEELEVLISGILPRSAYQYPSWWRAGRRAVWRAYGWRATPDVRRRTVRFDRKDTLSVMEIADLDDTTVQKVLSTRRRLVLIGGVAGKEEKPGPAEGLYRSKLWTKRRSYAVATACPWMILSAEYGLIRPETIIEPYDVTFRHESVAYRKAWSAWVTEDVVRVCETLAVEVVEIHAGADHVLNGLAAGLNAAGLTVSWPLRGRRIGDQFFWYKLATGALEAASRQRPGADEEVIDAGEASPPAHEVNQPVPASSVEERSNHEAKAEAPEEPEALADTSESSTSKIRSQIGGLAAAFRTGRDRPRSGASTRRDRVELSESITAFGQTLRDAEIGVDSQGDERIRVLIEEDPFTFVVAIIMSRRHVDERLWAGPEELYRRLGYADLESIATYPNRLQKAIARAPKMARSPERLARWISGAALTVISEYEGDASRIWRAGSSETEVRRRLEDFKGLGSNQSTRAIALIETFVTRLTERNADPLVINDTQRRVLLRAGLIEFDDLTHMTLPLLSEYPDNLRMFHEALEEIGESWCFPSEPACDSCPIGEECPRILGRIVIRRPLPQSTSEMSN